MKNNTTLEYPIREMADDEVPAEYRDVDAVVAGLNAGQRAFCDAVMLALEDPTAPRLFFLTGVAGTGRTHTCNTLIAYCLSKDIKVVVTAYTDITANFMISGVTSNEAFGLPFEDAGLNMNRSNIKLQSKEAERFREC